jgi:hypothetical protein
VQGPAGKVIRVYAVSTPSPFVVKPVLAGRKVTLRPFRDDDLPAIAAALADAEVLRLTGSVHGSAEATGRQPHADERMRNVSRI